VIVEDLRREARFKCPALDDEACVSGICVIIERPGGTGVIDGCFFAGSRSLHPFTAEDVEFIDSAAQIIGSVIYRQSTEEALKKSEERFDLLSRALRDGVLVALGPEGSVFSWNAPAERMFGWRAEDVVGKHVSGLSFDADDTRGVIEGLIAKAAVAEGQIETETWLRRRDGTRFRAQLSLTPLRNDDGKNRGTAMFVRDETAHYEAEAERLRLTAELERQRDTLEAVIEQFPAGVVFHNATDRSVQFVSKALARLYGSDWARPVAFDDIVANYPATFPDGRRLAVGDYGGVRALDGETVRQEVVILRGDGTRCPVIDCASPVYDRHGQLVGSVASVTDVTPEKEAALERERLLEETRRAVRARDDTLAVVSHDLRNPVSVISLAAAQLSARADTLDPASTRKIAARVHRAAANAEKIISDLLDFARIETGRLVVQLAEQNVRECVGDAVEALAELAAQRGVTIESNLVGLGSIRLRCDRARVVQVLSNLIGNAIKFVSPGDRIVVEGRTDEHDVIIAVRDHGPGIDADHLAHIFDRYWQADTKDPRRGLGLGLAIVKGIVEAHGGRVWAESSVGQGATFVFTLPRTA
jgi:PAS domain S-box-containing protein